MIRPRSAPVFITAAVLSCSLVSAAPTPVSKLTESYLETYFRMFPTLATAAGRHDLDEVLEDLSPPKLEAWVKFNQTTRSELLELIKDQNLPFDDRLDAKALL